MQQVAKGDLDKLRVLFERYHKYIFNFLHKMSGDRMLSEDLTQEVFYKVMKYRSTYSNGKFLTWLFTIARNTLNTHYSRDKNSHDRLDDQQEKHLSAPREDSEDHTHLQMALDRLEAGDRELIILNRIEGIRYNELAGITGSTPGAVKTRVCRALKKLKAFYFENR